MLTKKIIIVPILFLGAFSCLAAPGHSDSHRPVTDKATSHQWSPETYLRGTDQLVKFRWKGAWEDTKNSFSSLNSLKMAFTLKNPASGINASPALVIARNLGHLGVTHDGRLDGKYPITRRAIRLSNANSNEAIQARLSKMSDDGDRHLPLTSEFHRSSSNLEQ